MRYHQIAARVFDTPLLIHPGKLDTVLRVLGPRFGLNDPAVVLTAPEGAEVLPEGATERPLAKADAETERLRRRMGYRVEDGVAVVDIMGTLVKRPAGLDAMSGVRGYEDMEKSVAAALTDGEARSLVLNIDSFGGEAAGVKQLADRIRAGRESGKRIVAVANEYADSAAYWIASAADEVVVTPAGEVGSVGVIVTHADLSKAVDKAGIVVTHVHAGQRKADFSPWKPLSDADRARLQDEVDFLYEMFAGAVAANRGMSLEDIKATEALTFTGSRAVEAGLADRVGTLSETIAGLRAGPSGAAISRASLHHHSTENTMAEDKTKAGAETGRTDPAPKPPASAAGTNGDSEPSPAPAASDQRQRIKGILNAPEAEGRAELAQHLAFETEMSADEAKALLAKAPREAAAAAAPGAEFAAAMATAGNPQVGADRGDEEEAPDAAAVKTVESLRKLGMSL